MRFIYNTAIIKEKTENTIWIGLNKYKYMQQSARYRAILPLPLSTINFLGELAKRESARFTCDYRETQFLEKEDCATCLDRQRNVL